MKINNVNGLTLNGDLTIQSGIALNAGNFTIGPNTLTFNGIVTSMIGTVTGGTSTNMIIGGNGGVISMPSFTLNNLTINRASGVDLYGNLDIVGTLNLINGTLSVNANTLTISGNSPTRTSGNVDVTNASANLIFANTSAIVLPASFFSGAINNLTLSGIGGVTAGSDMTINGVLNLVAANPLANRGLLEMTVDYTNYPGTTITDYLNSHILNIGAAATIIGTGDVTGIVKRSTIVANTPYTFGHQSTTLSLTSGTMPSAIAVTITIGTTVPGPTSGTDIIRDAIKRTYEIVPTGGSNCFVSANFHYLMSELTSSITSHVNSESFLTTMDYDIDAGGHGFPTSDEHGRANFDNTNDYIGLSGMPISYFIQIPTTHEWRTIFTLRDYDEDYITWDGSTSTDWKTPSNWTVLHGGDDIPTPLSHVIIPDAATTPNDPILPSVENTTINTLTLENGSVLVMNSDTLTIQNSFSGGWEDQNPLGNDPGTSTVIFTRSNTSLSGNSRFYNVKIASNVTHVGDITNQVGSKMQIAGAITRTGLETGKWFADVYGATIEYNGGSQTIIIPDGTPNYHNLVLSGSGTKTLPSSTFSIHGSLTVTGTATASANATIDINENLIIDSSADFVTGAYNHNISGNFNNNGTFTPTIGGTITMNSSIAEQFIEGSSALNTFYNLTLNNTFITGMLHITSPATVNNTLTLTNNNIITHPGVPFVLSAGSSVSPTGGSALSFVDGALTKEGTTAFVFPLGNGTRWARLGIGAPSVSTSFQGQYFASADTNTSYMAITPFPVLSNVSTQEYWQLNRTVGSGDVILTLYWEDAAWSGIDNCSDLRIAHRNAVDSTWENNNDAVTTLGSCSGTSSGSITTSNAVTMFSPFTFGTIPSAGNPLPIELLSFDASYNKPDVELNWVTTTEINNAYFVVEKSLNAVDFVSIKTIQGMGNSNVTNLYSTLDNNPVNGVNYYRLRQIDFDGKTTLSKIVAINVSIEIKDNLLGITIFPNPTKGMLYVNSLADNLNLTISISDVSGKEVYFQSGLNLKSNAIDIESLSKGIYFLKINNNIDQKIVKIIRQ